MPNLITYIGLCKRYMTRFSFSLFLGNSCLGSRISRPCESIIEHRRYSISRRNGSKRKGKVKERIFSFHECSLNIWAVSLNSFPIIALMEPRSQYVYFDVDIHCCHLPELVHVSILILFFIYDHRSLSGSNQAAGNHVQSITNPLMHSTCTTM
jgi:hypothetical protein